ncbi:uncharacterized protein EDB91DRAFT_1082486 [Suillus paluster]|uniref:uncharacterized protein n=1 Tax=Suillus paluster TaxID=48578 RepID=UPI001B86D74C|nr:uncharacterized protein EDB91DRAFT_1082486 [Suillus paluster]KAG1739154.1 hypothetical protein EDB91DRAFT_1082486 [Suillus paluster]
MATKAGLNKPAKMFVLKAWKDLCTEMESTAGRTAILEARQGEVRHKDFKAAMEKHQLKVLHAAYKKKPEEFNIEPAELLSDINMEEENMFSDHCVPTKVSKSQVLMFSTSKTPPAVSAPKSFSQDHLSMDSSLTVSAPKSITPATIVSSSDDSGTEDEHKSSDIESVNDADYTSDHCNQAVVKDASPQLIGTKHQLQDSDEETKPPKFSKTSNGSRQ